MRQNNTPGEELTAKQSALIVALLSEPTIAEAAQVAGISRDTAHRWLRLAAVQSALKKAREQVFTHGLNELQAGMNQAIATLKRNMTDTEVQPAIQVRAAQIWLDMALKSHEMTDIKEQLAELQTLIKEKDRESNHSASNRRDASTDSTTYGGGARILP